MSDDVVIIGSGPAGLAAAKAYREAGGSAEVRLVSADESAPYDRPPLSKDYLRGESQENAISLQSESFYAEQHIRLLLGRHVSAVDPTHHMVHLDARPPLSYGTLILATGARPKPLPFPGATDERVHYLRSVADARSLRATAEKAERAVVIGSGFIGCEAASSLATRGLHVTQITDESTPQAGRLGAFAGEQITQWLTSQDITLVTAARITAIRDGHTVVVEGRDDVHADLILVAGGIQLNSELAAGAGILLEGGRIPVDASMRTTLDGVFAAGDVVRAQNVAAGRALGVEHWDDADRMGTIAGKVAAGQDAQWDAVPGFWSEIGPRTLQYAAWGDGYDEARPIDHGDGAFTVWYSREGTVVGVLTHKHDDDYNRGSKLIAEHASVEKIGT